MKKIRILFSIFLTLGFVACSDSFLDVEPQLNLSPEMAFSNFADAEVALTGAYEGLQGSANYYSRDFIVTPDVASDDVRIAPENSGRFLAQYNYNVSSTTGYVTGLWNRAYNTINRANTIISQIDKLDDATEEQVNHLHGQALAIRALAHFDLVRTFGRPYSWDNGDSDGVPYMTEPVISQPPRDPVHFVYENIVNDLTTAYELMEVRNSAQDRAYFTHYTAKALLSRVYLYKEEWQLAADYAIEVIEEGGYELIENDDYVESWTIPITNESIFSLPMSLIDYRATDALGYIYIPEGYGDARPTNDIVELLEEYGGVRYEAFIVDHPVREDFMVIKYPGRENTPGLDNVPVIRLAEMYLNAAEALANLNEDEDASEYLTFVVQRANPDADEIDMSGEELLERVYLERRLELAFEGHRLFDITRRKQDLDRGDCDAQVCFVPHGDSRFVYPIPQRELDANENIN